MAHTIVICPICNEGHLRCDNTQKINKDNKHVLEWSRISSWTCDNKNCNKYYKLYTPESELVSVTKRNKHR